MTARHAPPPRHRIAAASVWADNLPQPCKWATFLAAVALVGLGLGVPFVGGLNTQAQAAADEHRALTVERPAEPVGHGGLGGPVAPLSIGVVAPETDVPVVPPIVRSSRPPQRPQEALGTTRGSTDTQPTPTGAPSDAPAAATSTSEPTVAEPTQAATTTATTTPPTTTTRTCHRWWCHASPATTSETATPTATVPTTTSATEPSDPLATLISDVLEETP